MNLNAAAVSVSLPVSLPVSIVAAVFGTGIGVGLLLVVVGLRGPDPDRAPRRRRRLRPTRVPREDRVVLLRRAGMVAVGVVTAVGTGWVVAGVAAAAGFRLLPAVLGPDREQQRRIARIEAVAGWTEMLRDVLSAASGLEQALIATAELAPAAIAAQVQGLAVRLRRGDRLVSALRATAAEVDDPTADLVIAALVLAAEHQARRLAELLGSLAETAREQAGMRLRVEAGRARSRTAVRVITATTLTFAVGLVVVDRPYLAAYDTPLGQAVLLGVGGLFAAGFAAMRRVTAAADPARVLATPTAATTPTASGTAAGGAASTASTVSGAAAAAFGADPYTGGAAEATPSATTSSTGRAG